MKRGVHAVAWVLLAMTAFILWPERWGGSMTYVITSGSSMAPTFEAGDLAVLRSAEDYDVGDVAAFRSSELDGTIVMHRVKSQQDGVLRFQGDANDFVDPDEVRQDEVLGRLVLRVPGLGSALTWLTQPMNLVLAALGLFLLTSDRRKEEPSRSAVPPALGVVLVSRVEMPFGTAVVDVVDAHDLERLSNQLAKPVLRDVENGIDYLIDGSTTYRYCAAEAAEVAERRRGTGRDWQYGPSVVELPRPRRQRPRTTPSSQRAC